MNNRIDAIYARQSVDKKDSISIESQIEFCKYELKGGNCKEYKDKGYSGKNTERPEFQQLMRDIESGLVRKVVVYKLDRISRSILDFAKMMDFFQKYEVEFVSSTEKFDTSTPMGRAMLNICIVFAQLERETIQKRVVNPDEAANIRLIFEMYAKRWHRCYAILCMCRQTLMCTSFSKVKGQSLSMTLPILRGQTAVICIRDGM